MFFNCRSLKELDLSNFNTNNVTNMSYMFNECKSLKELNLINFNTNNVTNMTYMFNQCNSLKWSMTLKTQDYQCLMWQKQSQHPNKSRLCRYLQIYSK